MILSQIISYWSIYLQNEKQWNQNFSFACIVFGFKVQDASHQYCYGLKKSVCPYHLIFFYKTSTSELEKNYMPRLHSYYERWCCYCKTTRRGNEGLIVINHEISWRNVYDYHKPIFFMYTYIPTIKIQFEVHRKNRLRIHLIKKKNHKYILKRFYILNKNIFSKI